ncbi:MAG: hypothetical protein M1833_006119 [Piccolia ochrophora]|nr:MAG: hypothetical protein M1833_006119 [Piccolia ochrophora]
MSSTSKRLETVVPARLSFLAIYNPSLGLAENTLPDQIVYYSSHQSRSRKRRSKSNYADDDAPPEEKNERLRQIGLAQGMIEFARSFSNGEAVDSIETEKSRIILHELERGWWILASIDLTHLPSTKGDGASPTESNAQTIEYSAREVAPPALLLQQLLRAHSTFLLHHAPSMDDLYLRLSREKFCDILDRFWTNFVSNWDVLLHGNPTVDIIHGTKLAAGGELGIGVGEEEWGSGERAVLEGMVERTDGLLDMVVSRFGPAPVAKRSDSEQSAIHEHGTSGNDGNAGHVERSLSPQDGVIFSGVGALSRLSLRSVASWMEAVHLHGDDAFGIQQNPAATLRRRKRKQQRTSKEYAEAPSASRPIDDQSGTPESMAQGVPPPIFSAANDSSERATSAHEQRDGETKEDAVPNGKVSVIEDSPSGSATMMKYLTLGYGSSWSLGTKPALDRRVSDLREGGDESARAQSAASTEQETDTDTNERKNSTPPPHRTNARFLIGLQGDIESEEPTEGEDDDTTEGVAAVESSSAGRIVPRTVYVELDNATTKTPPPSERKSSLASSGTHSLSNTATQTNHRKLRVVVYSTPPFLYTLLFDPTTDAITLPTFYRTMHTHLKPLHGPLLTSTSPTTIAIRLASQPLLSPYPPPSSLTTSKTPPTTLPIYDLLYDPATTTIHSSLPNIPPPGYIPPTESSPPDAHHYPWSRIEALAVHAQLLATYTATRRRPAELERTAKTSRGWWVVWMRLPSSSSSSHASKDAADARHPASEGPSAHVSTPPPPPQCKEAFLIRKASDQARAASGSASVSSMSMSMARGLGFGGGRRDGSESGAGAGDEGGGAGWAPAKLAEGIGVDARRYVEGLLSLNR